MIGISIQTRDRISPTLRRLAEGITPERINPVIGRSAVNTFKEHLRGLNSTRANRLGGKRTNFFLQAARGTQFRTEGDSIIVSINQVGIRQRYFGGVIRPKGGRKFLTIPVHPDAHGKRASEFPGLVLIFGKRGAPIALARPVFKQRKRGAVGPAQPIGGEILFRLARFVTQRADESVLPESSTTIAGIEKDAGAYLRRLAERQGEAAP